MEFCAGVTVTGYSIRTLCPQPLIRYVKVVYHREILLRMLNSHSATTTTSGPSVAGIGIRVGFQLDAFFVCTNWICLLLLLQ